MTDIESPAETAARMGIPGDKLANLLEHPKVCELLVTARDNPNLQVEQIAAQIGLPVCDPTGLDFDILERELDELRALATRSSGDQGPIEQRMDYPILRGQLDVAREQAERRLKLLERARDELVKPGAANLDGLVASIKLEISRAE